MTSPITLTLVRHGESESNAAKRAAEKGKPHPNEAALMDVHTSERRLTPRGVEQAKQAGRWLRQYFAGTERHAIRGYVSPYARAAETAGLLGLNLSWYVDSRLCERNWGHLDQMTHEARMEFFREDLARREKFALFWAPPGGESMKQVFLLLRDWEGTLHRECTNMHVLAVCHGETMWAERYLREYWVPRDLSRAMQSNDRRFKILNCRIIQYSREDQNGVLQPRFARVRFIDPRDPENAETNHDWLPVQRKLFSSNDLLEYASSFDRFLEAS